MKNIIMMISKEEKHDDNCYIVYVKLEEYSAKIVHETETEK